MHALSIRQPYAELILRGVKTVEYRSRPTKMIGRRFCIYVPLKMAAGSWESAAGEAERLPVRESRLPSPASGCQLPTGVIVGSAVIARCSPPSGKGEFGGYWQWHLKDVRRYKRPRKLPVRKDGSRIQPQPVWFRLKAA